LKNENKDENFHLDAFSLILLAQSQKPSPCPGLNGAICVRFNLCFSLGDSQNFTHRHSNVKKTFRSQALLKTEMSHGFQNFAAWRDGF
jgi:hypothetical protein